MSCTFSCVIQKNSLKDEIKTYHPNLNEFNKIYSCYRTLWAHNKNHHNGDIKTVQNEIIEEMPEKVEKPARKSGKEVLEENKRIVKAKASAWPADVCALVRFLAEVRDEDLPEDMLELKKDAVSGEFKGYDAYPSIRGMIANMPAADEE